MMNKSKAKHSDGNDPSKSRPPEKHRRTQKASKNKNGETDNQSSSSRKQDGAILSTAGRAGNNLEQPLTRRPLRNTSNEETGETISVESSHIPLVIPKREKPDNQRKSFHLARDPRMTTNPIMERDDDTDEDISNEAFPPNLTNDDLVHTEDVLQSTIDINVENVKNEIDDLGLEENSDWKTRFLSEENTSTEEPITVPAVQIKSEPFDENDFNPTSEPIEDDRCSIDSGSTVGLPSPGRASPPPFPTPSLKTGEDNQTTAGISDDSATPRISPDEQLISRERKDGEEEDFVLENNDLPTTNNSISGYYSTPTDLEEEYRKLEKEKAAATTAAAAAAASKQDYSRENTDVSSEDEMSMLTANHVNQSFHNNNDFGDDDDGEPFCDYHAEKDPSWATPEPTEDIRPGQKRPLPIDETADIYGTTNLPAKKSKFQVVKFPQDSTGSVINHTDPADDVASSAPRSPASSSNTGTPTPQPSSEMESEVSSAQPVTSTDKNQPPTRSRLPVKLTTTNRASMMVEDFLNSANISAAKVPNKRAQTPTKTTPKRKKQPVGDRSTPPPFSEPTSFDFSDNVPGVRDIRGDNLPRQQNLLALTSGSRDPRLKTRMENKDSSSTMNQQTTPSGAILNLSRALKIKILMRVLKLWQFKWIEQQTFLKDPPPLLDEDRNYPLEIPQLSCVPVLTRYCDMQSYWDIFHPLMLHEMWSTLVLKNNQKEKKFPNLKCLIKSAVKEDKFVLLQCALLVEHEAEAPAVNDLVVFTFTRPTGELIHPFGFVESSKTTKEFKMADFDRSLIPKNKSKVKFSAEVVIRVIKNYAPKNYVPGQKDIIETVAKVTSLSAFMDLFHAQAAFDISPLRDIILHPRPSAFELTYSHPLFMMEYMDQVQTDAYHSIGQTMLISSNEEPKIAVLQGYPGTGKTHVIVYIINHLVGHKLGDVRNKVLYCAPTDAAVDEMTRRLLRFNRSSTSRFDVLRMGSWARLHPDVKEATLEDKLARLRARIKHENPTRKELQILKEKLVHLQGQKESIIKELNLDFHSHQRITDLEDKLSEVNDEIKTTTDFLQDNKKLQDEAMEKVLQDEKRLIICQADVICTTLEGCRSTEMETIFLDRKRDSNGQIPRPFLCCIIDDASLCTEPQTLIPLALGMKKLILVGDVELLPFTLNSSVAKESRLDQSLFSRLHSYLSIECSGNERLIFSLNTQHRMDPEICRWTSKYYYGNRLLTSPTSQPTSPLHAYRVLDVRDSLETPDGSNCVNLPEAEVILKILECMVSSPAMIERSIGIITFYEQQRILIRHLIKERLPRNYTRTDVRLVQDLQGTEMDVVIISCVKTKVRDRDRNLAMLTDHWNVALTRAIESLFICGHLKTLQTNEVLKDLVSDADKRQVIYRVSSKFERSMLYDILLKPAEYVQL